MFLWKQEQLMLYIHQQNPQLCIVDYHQLFHFPPVDHVNINMV